MAKQTDYSLCRDCKSRKVEYRVSTTGTPLKHGYCRDCYERNAAKSVRGCGRFCTPRDPEKMENVRETKFGIDR